MYVILVAQMVKNPPTMQETQVRSLVWEDPLEKEMATHSSILAYRILLTEEPGGLWSMGSQRWTQLSHTHTQYYLSLRVTNELWNLETIKAGVESWRAED